MPRRLLFIINPAAGGGRGRRKWGDIERQWVRKIGGGTVIEIPNDRAGEAPALLGKVFSTKPGEAREIAAAAAGAYDILVAVGGDGTVWEVANGILTSKASRAGLAIIPGGTGNDIARNIGVRTVDDAFSSIYEGQPRPVDVIRIECTDEARPMVLHALSFVGVGIIGPLLRTTTSTRKRVFGRTLTYKIGLAWTLCTYKPPNVRVTCDGQVFKGRFLFLGASNGEHAGGGLRLAPGARMDDGVLEVNLVGAVGRVDGLRQLGRVARGEHTGHPKVRYFQSRTITVEADTKLDVAVDGELAGQTPARFEVMPRALMVFTNG